MVRDAVRLDEVDTPGGVEMGDGVVVRLAGWSIRVYAVVVGVPRARGVDVGGFCGSMRRALDRQVTGHCLPRDTAQDVDPEFKTERVHIVGQGLESYAPRGRWESVRCRDVAPVGVEHQQRSVGVARRCRIADEPFRVDYRVVPAIACEMPAHPADIGAKLSLRDGRSVGIVTVPAHWRMSGDPGRGGG